MATLAFYDTPGVRSERFSSLRDAKAALTAQIERQRKVIEDHDRQADRNPTAVADDDLNWYTLQSAHLESLTDELVQLRLRGSEFKVRGRQGAGQHILDVSPSGRLVLYEVVAGRTSTSTSTSTSGAAASTVSAPAPSTSDAAASLTAATPSAAPPPETAADGPAFRKLVDEYYIDALVKVRAVESGTVSFGAVQAGSGDKLIRLDLKGAPALTLAVADPDELLYVLGSLLNRFNRCKVRQVRRLAELIELKTTAFSRSNRHHEHLLHRLWQAVFPGEPVEARISEKWKLLGFQSKDPTSDLRGMGILGLHTLVYFVEQHTAVARAIVYGNRAYPFAAVGINVTQLLCNLLNLTDDLAKRPATDPKWDSDILVFFAYQDHDRVFEELFSTAYRLLDATFQRERAGYMDFPAVYDQVQERLRRIFEIKANDTAAASGTSADTAARSKREQRPLSFDELHALLGWTD